MFPQISIGCCVLSSDAMWIVVSFLAFVWSVRIFSNSFGLKFYKFISLIYLFVLLPYLLGRWLFVVFNYKIVLPTSFDYILAWLFSPQIGYHFVWIIVGFLLALLIFLKFASSKWEKKLRIDALVYSFLIGAFVMGIFLTLGDSFYWRITESFLGISSFVPDSAIYGLKVYPVGLFVSLVSIILFIGGISILQFKKRAWWGRFVLIAWIALMNLVFVYVAYSRQGILIVWDGYTNLFFWIVGMLFSLILFVLVSKKLKGVGLGMLVLILVAYLYFLRNFINFVSINFAGSAIGIGWYSFDILNYASIIIILWMVLYYLHVFKWN